MKMHDVGHEYNGAGIAPESPKGKSYPTISLNESQCPFIKNWPTGENYELVIKVHKTGDHEPRPFDYDGETGMIHEFEIRSVGYADEKEKT